MSYKLEKPFTVTQRADFVCEHQGLNYYEDDNCIIMYADSESVIDGVVTDISQTSDYKSKQKSKAKKQIQEKYKNIMNEYVCAKVKRDLFETAEYQSMIDDMYAEIGAL